ncbi:hypothetical protein ACFWNT_42000 [Streptomyces sp. NPDC058409]|uniref:hypothetical protein n=1 Tax=Streptomyces sp. NPDC058409 TaxID=3346484 RepID=UPI003666125D
MIEAVTTTLPISSPLSPPYGQAPSWRPSSKPGSTRGRTRGTSTWPTTTAAAQNSRSGTDQLLAAAAPGTVYDPDTDDVVQAELAAEAAAVAAREAELREAARIAARADELRALRELGTLEQAEPREGDEAARDELTRHAGGR